MLVIRTQQLRIFELRKSSEFEQRLIQHCRRFFPRAAAALGPRLLGAVRESLDEASRYGFKDERDLCKYINIVFTFGRQFDRSPLIPWAAEVLSSALPGPAKMQRLYAAALQHERDGRGYFAPRDEPR
jgi:hypothetical protein